MYNEDNLKRQLTNQAIKEIKQRGWSQNVASLELEVPDSTINYIMKRRLKRYSIKKLAEILSKLGFEFEIKLTKI